MPSRIIRSDAQYEALCRLLAGVQKPFTVTWSEGEKRNDAQNRKMWAMIRDVSNAQPEGRRMTPDEWKCVFMQAAGWEVQFLEGLDGRPFPAGFRSSRMTVKQMADLITFIQAYGDHNGIVWRDARQWI